MAQETNQIDANYDAFLVFLPHIRQSQAGRFALLHDAQIVDFFDTSLKAFLYGAENIGVGQFSVQEVSDTIENLGFYSYAGASGQA